MPDLSPLNFSSYRAQLALRTLAGRLREARLRRGLTQREAALLAGIRLAAYRRLERADGTISAYELIRALSLLSHADDALADASGDIVDFHQHHAPAAGRAGKRL